MSEFLSVLSVTPLADGQQWRLNEPFRYRSNVLLAGRRSNVIEVPEGFITDFASIPRFIQGVLPPWNRYGPAAIVHDWLYWSQAMPRELADTVLREAMSLLGVDGQTIALIHNAVRVFGGGAWDADARVKETGYTRMAPIGNEVAPYASPT